MDKQILINDFAIRSLRDTADQDYIAARMSHRANLIEPFLWCSLHAIEKYLKAILLFNHSSAKGIGHNIWQAVSHACRIADIKFTLPEDVLSFVRYLNQVGSNRYLEDSSYVKSRCLLQLDRSIWYIRRYCYYMRGDIRRSDGTRVPRLPVELARVHDKYYEDNPHKYHISGGYIETVIQKKSPSLQYLTWQNFYFSRKKRAHTENYPDFSCSLNPTLVLHPEAYECLKDLFQFSEDVKKRFKTPSANETSDATRSRLMPGSRDSGDAGRR